MTDKVLNGCAIVAGIVLLLMVVIAAWMVAILAPGVRDIIDALK